MPREHVNPKGLFPSLPHGFSQIVVSRENPPASTWIGVSALAVPDFLIEIEATAVLD